MEYRLGLPYLQKQNSGQCMPVFHEIKYMRFHILSHQNSTYEIGKATNIVVANIFDWGGQTTIHLQWRHQNFSQEEVFVGQRYRKVEDQKPRPGFGTKPRFCRRERA